MLYPTYETILLEAIMGNGDVLVRLDKEEMERLLIRYVNELDLEFHPNALEHLKSRVNIGAIEKAITMKKVVT